MTNNYAFNVSFLNSRIPPLSLFPLFSLSPLFSLFLLSFFMLLLLASYSLFLGRCPLLPARSLLVAPCRFSVIAHLLFATTLRYVFVSFFSIFSLECIPRLFDSGSIPTYLRGGHSHGGHHGRQ